MKLWIDDQITPTHRIVRLNAEEHSELTYLGDLNQDEIRAYFTKLQPTMDVETNIHNLHYFGYLHLFIPSKNHKNT